MCILDDKLCMYLQYDDIWRLKNTSTTLSKHSTITCVYHIYGEIQPNYFTIGDHELSTYLQMQQISFVATV